MCAAWKKKNERNEIVCFYCIQSDILLCGIVRFSRGNKNKLRTFQSQKWKKKLRTASLRQNLLVLIKKECITAHHLEQTATNCIDDAKTCDCSSGSCPSKLGCEVLPLRSGIQPKHLNAIPLVFMIHYCYCLMISGKCRSSHGKCSVKTVFFEISQKFTGKDLCQCLFFNEVAGHRHLSKSTF